MSGSYVLVGLVHPRSGWPAELARWATSGAAPIEFLACLTGDEVRAVLASGRPASAVLLDGSLPQVDRDLVAAVQAHGAAALGVDGPRLREWDTLGCDAALPAGFGRDLLIETLQRHCAVMTREPVMATHHLLEGADRAGRGTVVAVTGCGGAGASTVAMALAQGLANDDRPARTERRGPESSDDQHRVAVIDGARRADLAMYHDVGDVIPGLPELAEAHRGGTCDPAEIRRLLFAVPARHYDVLLGLRRSRDWAALRPRAVRAGLDGLARAYDTVVVDMDPDLDREATTGSLDIEDRHTITLAMAERADAVLVVAGADTRGVHGLVRLVDEFCDAGVPPHRLLPVVNGAPRSPAVRSRITATVARLTAGRHTDGSSLPPPIFLGDQRRLEASHRDVAALPQSMARPLARGMLRVTGRHGAREHVDPSPRPVRPGQLATHLGALRTASGSGPERPRPRAGGHGSGPDSEVG